MGNKWQSVYVKAPSSGSRLVSWLPTHGLKGRLFYAARAAARVSQEMGYTNFSLLLADKMFLLGAFDRHFMAVLYKPWLKRCQAKVNRRNLWDEGKADFNPRVSSTYNSSDSSGVESCQELRIDWFWHKHMLTRDDPNWWHECLYFDRVWFNSPTIIPAKVSRFNSISNPPTHGFKWIKGTKTIPKTVWSM